MRPTSLGQYPPVECQHCTRSYNTLLAACECTKSQGIFGLTFYIKKKTIISYNFETVLEYFKIWGEKKTLRDLVHTSRPMSYRVTSWDNKKFAFPSEEPYGLDEG